jgi:hypothetical protein
MHMIYLFTFFRAYNSKYTHICIYLLAELNDESPASDLWWIFLVAYFLQRLFV